MADESSEVLDAPKAERLLSIDALRGFDMIWIAGAAPIVEGIHKIFDNEWTAAMCKQLHHVEWEGFAFEDIIMPLFMFLAGLSLVISFNRRAHLQSKARMYGHVLVRVVILWVLGMIYQGELLDLKWENLEFYSNTLQAIAAGYLGSALILLFKDVRVQAFLTLALLIGYFALMHFVEVPEHGAGQLTLEGNLAAHVDTVTMGIHDDVNDEGISAYTWVLSSMTFVVTVMLGCFAGQIILHPGATKPQVACRLQIFGLLLLGIGYLWTMPLLEPFQDPCIKKIWTSSFTLISGGYCVLLLAFFYLQVEIFNIRWPAKFFAVIGANAIFVYMVFAYRRFIDMNYPAEKLVYGLEEHTGNAYPLIVSVVAFMLMWGILYVMYRKKIFVKI